MTPLLILTIVKASGGRTPSVQTSPLPSGFEINTEELEQVKKRKTCHANVISVGAN